MIPRQLTKAVLENHKEGFIDVIYGPRRVGKTVLLDQIKKSITTEKIAVYNGDDLETREKLSITSKTNLSEVVQNIDTLIIDEAQRIPNIALSLKILIDNFPQKRIIVTGSSSLQLSRGSRETLTGRTWVYNLYPLSTNEITRNIETHRKPYFLEQQLRFGGYPKLTQLSKESDKQIYLRQIIEDYLFKDLVELQNIDPEILYRLTKLLAFQIGSEASLNELAAKLGINIRTVQRYISFLKQSFVIISLGAFSKNLRKEVVKSQKYYFWDLGIRNALIGQFSTINLRPDLGALWENFLIIERIKKFHYSREDKNYFFWRTYEKAEIDWIESEGEGLSAYEFKWKQQKARTPKAFKEAYKEEVKVISKENYLEFVS